VGLVSRFGQFYKAVDPGLVQVNVCTESLRVVDVKIQIISIGRQTVITRDNVNVEMYVYLVCQTFPSPTSPLFTRSIFWGDGLTQRTNTTQ
jgi:regulator of protease activity HflC (stomatin/prohibitin superfamily)